MHQDVFALLSLGEDGRHSTPPVFKESNLRSVENSLSEGGISSSCCRATGRSQPS